MDLANLLRRAALSWNDRTAIALGDRQVATFAEWDDRAGRLAHALTRQLGLSQGDRVAIAMTNAPAYLDILFGAWYAGLVAVPMNAKLHPREFAYILENSGARACFLSADLANAVSEIAGDVPGVEHWIETGDAGYARLFDGAPMDPVIAAPDDLAWLFYTSGTTGRPKGAMLSHRNLMSMTLNYLSDVDSIAPGDSIIHAAPMSHGSGLYIVPHVARGACQVVPESGGFEPDEIFELLPSHRGATLFFAPTMVTRLIDAPGVGDADLSNLKTIVYGGGPMYVEDCLRALDALGPKLVQIYGQGESPMTITCLPRAAHTDTAHPRYRQRLASVGTAFAGIDVRVADSDDRPLAADEIGEILVRGDAVMSGYWENPAASEETLRGGWLHTGDMGAIDQDGYLTLKDRSKDLIISGGSNIYPREVEEVLLQHDGVHEVSVIGGPHADWGEEVVAFVVARPGADVTEAALDALCLDRIARFKRPRVYRFIDALPKNNYGKVLKTALRQMLE
jgi:long-chain acyl-CoA synthetase